MFVAGAKSAIVCVGMDKKATATFIKQRAMQDLPQEDLARFIEIIETDNDESSRGQHYPLPFVTIAVPAWIETWR